MMLFVTLCLTASFSATVATNHLRNKAQMQPEQVATTLISVQDEWKAQAHIVNQCEANDKFADDLPTCKEARTAFDHSCVKVASAIMVSSSTPGDAKEYMSDVCGQAILSPWHKTKCNIVSTAITNKMSASAAENRQSYFSNAQKACASVWSNFVEEQHKLHDLEGKQEDQFVEDHAESKASSSEKPETKAIAQVKIAHEKSQEKVVVKTSNKEQAEADDVELVISKPAADKPTQVAAAKVDSKVKKEVPSASKFGIPKAAPTQRVSPSHPSEKMHRRVGLLQTAHSEAPADTLAKEMTHDLELNFNRIAPFGKEDTAKELQDHASKTQDTLVDAVENAEVAEIKRAVFRALTRLRAATIKEFDTIARLETQAIDAYNDAHHFRAENPLAHLHEDEAPVSTDKLKSFH